MTEPNHWAGARYVAMGSSSDPWTRRFQFGRGGAPYHPNAAGMAAVADLIAAALPDAPG